MYSIVRAASALLVLILGFQSGCTQLPGRKADAATSTAAKRTVTIRLPEIEGRAERGSAAAKFRERTFEITVPKRIGVYPVLPPPGVELKKPWRPLRYFGPFRSGSDLSQVQILLHEKSANWYYNGFFASIDPVAEPTALDVFRTYYRPNLVTGPLSSAVLPTNSPAPPFAPTASPTERQEGYAIDVLFSLAEVAYSERYGGSVRLRFELADVPTPNRPVPEPEIFNYEFGRERPAAGAPAWQFDVNDVSMLVFVRPNATFINPKNSYNFTVETFVEFDVRRFIAYRDGVALAAGAGRDELDSVLAVTAQRVIASLGGSNPNNIRPHHSLFTHAWIHNQHYGLIEFGNRVTQLFIGDEWGDPITTAYVPMVFASFRALSLSDGSADPGDTSEIDWDFEGDEEWRLRLRVFREFDGTATQIRKRTWHIDDEGDGTSWSTVVAVFPGQECQLSRQLSLRLTLTDEDPVGSDDSLDASATTVLLDCDAFDGMVSAGTWPVQNIWMGVIPLVEDGSSVTRCDSPPLGAIFGVSYCFGDSGQLVGEDVFGPWGFLQGEAHLTWEAKVDILAR